MKLRVAIVDDEALARERLRRLLRADSEVAIVADCGTGAEAVEIARQSEIDLMFLDVQMPGMDGFQVIRAIPLARLPEVVFVTGFDEHAVRAFEARALDYLVKPASAARLGESLARARDRLATKAQGTVVPQALLDYLKERESGNSIKRFTVRNGERTIFVPAAEVDWIEAAGNYVILHVGKATHILRETMTSLEEQLGRESFVRVSRSAIVNLDRLRELQTMTATEQVAVLADGQRVPVTRSIREIEQRLRFA
jgi:two-component system, LytTR family, response regulator